MWNCPWIILWILIQWARRWVWLVVAYCWNGHEGICDGTVDTGACEMDDEVLDVWRDRSWIVMLASSDAGGILYEKMAFDYLVSEVGDVTEENFSWFQLNEGGIEWLLQVDWCWLTSNSCTGEGSMVLITIERWIIIVSCGNWRWICGIVIRNVWRVINAFTSRWMSMIVIYW